MCLILKITELGVNYSAGAIQKSSSIQKPSVI